jgi:hypothetical protein
MILLPERQIGPLAIPAHRENPGHIELSDYMDAKGWLV